MVLTTTVALREQITATERRAYFRTLEDLRKRIGRLDKAQVNQLKNALISTQQEIIRILSAADGFSQIHIAELASEYNRSIAAFEARYSVIMGEAIIDHSELGVAMVDEPLDALGRLISGPMLSTELTELSTLTSADLVAGIGDDLRKRINLETRLTSMGVKTPFEAMQAIGRSGIKKGHFKTVAHRAEAIIRTETGRVRSLSYLSRLDQIDEQTKQDLDLKNKWVWSGISRPKHKALDGTMVKPGEKFWSTTGGKIPKPVSAEAPRLFGDPSNDIQCSCNVVLTVPELEEA
jgi:hypothetical protein